MRPKARAKDRDEGGALFEAIALRFTGRPGITHARMFDATVLKFRGKIFSMLVKGNLVVKLPRERAAALAASGTAQPFDPGHGRVMRQWAVIRPTDLEEWRDLVREAQAFVASDAQQRA